MGAADLDELDVLFEAELVDLTAHETPTIGLIGQEDDGHGLLGGGAEEASGSDLADERADGVKGGGAGHVVEKDEAMELFSPEGLWTGEAV